MAGEKISKALEAELDKIERECMRPLQLKAFQCSADCCRDQRMSHESLGRCLEGCMSPVAKAQENILNSEVTSLQVRKHALLLAFKQAITRVHKWNTIGMSNALAFSYYYLNV